MIKEVDTTDYEAYHNKKPRGQGRWVFLIFHSFRHQAEEWASTRPYGIAKQRALKYANSLHALKVSLDDFLSKPLEEIK